MATRHRRNHPHPAAFGTSLPWAAFPSLGIARLSTTRRSRRRSGWVLPLRSILKENLLNDHDPTNHSFVFVVKVLSHHSGSLHLMICFCEMPDILA